MTRWILVTDPLTGMKARFAVAATLNPRAAARQAKHRFAVRYGVDPNRLRSTPVRGRA